MSTEGGSSNTTSVSPSRERLQACREARSVVFLSRGAVAVEVSLAYAYGKQRILSAGRALASHQPSIPACNRSEVRGGGVSRKRPFVRRSRFGPFRGLAMCRNLSLFLCAVKAYTFFGTEAALVRRRVTFFFRCFWRRKRTRPSRKLFSARL